MASNVLHNDVALEVNALVRRTRWIRWTGISLTVTGVMTAVAALVGQICSRVVRPSITDFKLDVPEAVLGNGASFGHAFNALNFVYDWYISITGCPVFYVPLAIAMCYFTYKLQTGSFKPRHFQTLVTAVMMVMSPKFIDLISEVPSNHPGRDVRKNVERFVKDEEYSRLISYLKKSGSGFLPGSLSFDYVGAQIGVKEGKPNIPAIKTVIEGYSTPKPFATVPGSVRYSLEMTAFNEVVTDGARQYQEKQLSESAYLADKAWQGGLTGGGLFLIGGSILMWFRQMSRRVTFLKTSLSKR